MVNVRSQDSPKVEVSNFGPIADAKIDLRPLTIFVGASNTGKSYLATLIYAIHKCVVGNRSELYGRNGQASLLGVPPKDLPHSVRHDLAKWWIQNFFTKESAHEGFSAPLPESIASIIRSLLSGSNETGNYLSNEISRCFCVIDAGELIRRGQKESSITLRVPSYRHGRDDFADKSRLDYNIAITRSSTTARGEIPDRSAVRIMPNSNRLFLEATQGMYGPLAEVGEAYEQEVLAKALVKYLGDIAEMALPYAFGPLHRPAHYLPANRAGIIHGHRIVLRSLVNTAAKSRPHSSVQSPMMSGVLADFLNSLLMINKTPSHRVARGEDDLGQLIERHILGGSIRVDSTEMGYPFFLYRPIEWQEEKRKEDLPLTNSSSMVSELAPVVLYLREIVRPGDVLIIEEPESHLHPAMQAVFAKLLARVVKQGIRVIITTHSDWFLEQIGNLVRLSELPEEHRATITDGVALDSSEVGAWQFESQSASLGSRVTEVRLDPDTGLYPVDYGDVRCSLYNESARTFNKVQEMNGQ